MSTLGIIIISIAVFVVGVGESLWWIARPSYERKVEVPTDDIFAKIVPHKRSNALFRAEIWATVPGDHPEDIEDWKPRKILTTSYAFAGDIEAVTRQTLRQVKARRRAGKPLDEWIVK